MEPLRFIFMGTPDFALWSLQRIMEAGHNPVCIYTQPPRPSGRGQQVLESPVLKFAKLHGLTIETPQNLKDALAGKVLRSKTADVIVVSAYGLILPAEIVENTAIPCINIHASLLPRWRGAAPIQRAIMAGDDSTGITIMRMSKGLDTGPIIASRKIAIGNDNAGAVHDRVAKLGSEMIVECLDELSKGKLHTTPQATEGITYAHRLHPSDEVIDWKRSAREILLQIRALSPKPGASFRNSGDKWKVFSAEASSSCSGGAPGQVLDKDLTIACGHGTLQPQMIQRPGRKPLPAADVLRGAPVPVGTVLS